MNTNKASRKETLIPILGTIGTGLVVAAVISILGAAWPWLLLIFGIVLIVVAVLLSVPNTGRWFSVRHIAKWIHDRVTWWCHGPECIIADLEKPGKPLENATEVQYTATIEIYIKNKGKPVRVDLNPVHVFIEQKAEWRVLSIALRNYTTIPDILLEPWKEGHYQVNVSQKYTTKPEDRLNLDKAYKWGIWGVLLTLPRINTREIHKGIRETQERKQAGFRLY